MDTWLIVLAGITTALLVARFSNRRPMLVDAVFGAFAGIAGMALAQILRADGTMVGLGMPLFIACGLALGLESLQERGLRR